MNKKILFLGATHFQLAAIQCAKDKGHYVITTDNNPTNPGHQIADESHGVSTTDKSAILALSQILEIDGIVAYASDPAAPTAAYVSEKLGLPGNPYKTVYTMANKDEHRSFLQFHGFNTPKFRVVDNASDAINACHSMEKPLFIKPVDSSGSKGITVYKGDSKIKDAFEYASEFSRSGEVIIEEKVKRIGHQVAGDGFVVDGKLIFRAFANEHFNPHGIIPVGESWPSLWLYKTQDRIHAEIQRYIDCIGYKIGALNFDVLLDKNDDIYLMEIGPRNGGNLIPELTKLATGQDMIAATIDAAVGDPVKLEMKVGKGHYASYMIHSNFAGVFKEVRFSDVLRENILEKRMFVKSGDPINAFRGSNGTIGALILSFTTMGDMITKMENMSKHVKVELA